MQTVSAREERAKGPAYDARRMAAAWKYLAGFAGVFLFLFLVSDRRVGIYDEGILLTAAMRVLAGQVIHRDFYYNYGPATMYMTAGLFKIFGPSVLVERLLELFGNSLLVVSLYAITRRLCQPKVAWTVALYSVVWMFFGVGPWSLLAVVMLWPTWLLTKAFQEDVSGRRAFASGLLVGVATLIRYDMGAIIGCHVLAVAIASYVRRESMRSWAVSMGRSLWGYVLGVAVVVGPPTWAYLRVAPAHDFLFDIVIYTAKYYRSARALPFPWRHILQLQDFLVYVLVVVMAIGLYVATRYLIRHRARVSGGTEAVPLWIGLLVSFGLVAAIAYGKGLVRLSASGESMAAVPCIVMTAVLYEHRRNIGPGLRKTVMAMIVMFWITAAWGALHVISSLHKSKSSMLSWVLEPRRMEPRKMDSQQPSNTWCLNKNPVTRGVCYTIDSDHIQTVEFLEGYTRPGETLYVGLPQHDRIFANDNVTYFATQLVPATKWWHFEPGMQNSASIQQQMIADLQANKPRYVVLDSEFDAVHEPNGSSVHTGVHLLDNYIAQNYQWVKTFGEMTILERRPG